LTSATVVQVGVQANDAVDPGYGDGRPLLPCECGEASGNETSSSPGSPLFSRDSSRQFAVEQSFKTGDKLCGAKRVT
jgi:hypothetical protein